MTPTGVGLLPTSSARRVRPEVGWCCCRQPWRHPTASKVTWSSTTTGRTRSETRVIELLTGKPLSVGFSAQQDAFFGVPQAEPRGKTWHAAAPEFNTEAYDRIVENAFKAVLENPDAISKTVLGKGLDSGTAFEILSIDIADVDVGKNIGAELQTDQAEADKRVAQARAEERRAMAVAKEQEMKALVGEMRAEVVKAEAQVPLALADAFRQGNLGVMDFVKYRNIEADTSMRTAIAGPDETPNETLGE